ncbi:GbsR/MarR family transcriptional regulator [Rhodothermus marinus]|uniref:GbsR/MarR family transcriptional regulator n=1 Tax=Rhodothermus marinus TaxID=29549 RepID=UPI0012BA4598|nr:winged helix DNA-binding protein [Rhodothermus marinus]BBM70772.1 transcriptional regulator [Rhodothermus marinus]BBM73758.1 transcriptional regulator [Rhodothermus marinus]
MGRGLTPLQRDLVEEFGNIYEGYGLSRLKGLIVGLLLTQPEPLSLDDIATLLNRSKGPISSTIRELASIGLVRKVNGPENRRDYYVAHPDLFLNNFKFNLATVRKNRRTAEQFLWEMEASGDPAHQAAIERLRHMQAFYRLMEQFYENFTKEWERVRAQMEAANASVN